MQNDNPPQPLPSDLTAGGTNSLSINPPNIQGQTEAINNSAQLTTAEVNVSNNLPEQSNKKAFKKNLIVFLVVLLSPLLIFVAIKVEPFIFGLIAPNSIKTDDINRTVNMADLKKYGTITNDTYVYLRNTDLGHQLTRNITVSFYTPMSEIDVANLLSREGFSQDGGSTEKTYNGVEVFVDGDVDAQAQSIIFNSKYDHTSSGLDPTTTYKIYIFTFNTV
jgi:hypothetical protein